MKYREGSNPYRAEIVRQNLEALRKDTYSIAKLIGATSSIKTINIDDQELELLLAFYEGKEIFINETDDKE